MVRSTAEAAHDRRIWGFSLVELIVSIVILSIGVMSLAGTSTWVVRQVTLSRLITQRAVARQSAMERVMADSFATITGGSDNFGIFDVSWLVTVDGGTFKTVQVVTVGPGRVSGTAGNAALSSRLADTVFLRIASPGF